MKGKACRYRVIEKRVIPGKPWPMATGSIKQCGKRGVFAERRNPKIWYCKDHFEKHMADQGAKLSAIVLG